MKSKSIISALSFLKYEIFRTLKARELTEHFFLLKVDLISTLFYIKSLQGLLLLNNQF